jgi:hypothetical protein
MTSELRQWLCAIAHDAPSLNGLRHLSGAPKRRATIKFVSLLCEASEPMQLLPPYGTLLRSVVTRQGDLAVTLSNSRLDYAVELRQSLLLIVEHCNVSKESPHGVNAHARAAVSASAFAVFVANGIGIVEGGHAARLPRTVFEVRMVPAFDAILVTLDEHAARLGKPGGSPSSAALKKVTTASQSDQQAYLAALGVHVLSWLRHIDAHVFFKTFISALSAAASPRPSSRRPCRQPRRRSSARTRPSSAPTAAGSSIRGRCGREHEPMA